MLVVIADLLVYFYASYRERKRLQESEEVEEVPVPEKAGIGRGREGRRRLTRSKTLESLLRSSSKEGLCPKCVTDDNDDNTPTKRFRILSLDGGGIRGIFSARILERLVAKCPCLLDHFDLIAGSSTGALIALLLAYGYNPTEIINIYRVVSRKIFKPSLARSWNPFNARYSGELKKELIEQIVGKDVYFSDLQRHVLIPAFCLDGIGDTRGYDATFYRSRGQMWRASLFCNLPTGCAGVNPDMNLKVVDAAMRATAAPTYYPIYQGYCDGAVFANNPSMCALSRALAYKGCECSLSDFTILSIGTGIPASSIPGKIHDWGLIQWGEYLLSLLMDATESATDMNLEMLIGDAYCRVEALLPINIGLDDVQKSDALIAYADQVDLDETIEYIQKQILADHGSK